MKKFFGFKARCVLMFLVFVIILMIIFNMTYNLKGNKENLKIEPLKELKITKQSNITKSETYPTDGLLINPGKGLVLRDYLDERYDNLTAVSYYRFEWVQIEPEKGKYNWYKIDSMIESCARRGKKFAFGVINANSTSRNVYVTPKWVFDEGAESYTCKSKIGVNQVIPKWTDKIFLEEVNNFIKVLSERYDGNENIAYIDIRSYGNYGEQHLINICGNEAGIGGEDITAEQLEELYIKPYKEAFKKTLLVNTWGKTEYNTVYNNSIDSGISIRRDGIMKLYNGKPPFEYAYGKLPTIFEYYANYNELKKNGLWSEKKLLNYIEEWKPSYLEYYREMYLDNPSFCNYIGNKIGYYFKLKETEYVNDVKENDNSRIKMKFINEGVAPLYEDCTVYMGLLDNDYNLVQKYKTNINPHNWLPNKEVTEVVNTKFDGVSGGKYILAVGLFLDENDNKPTYLLGNTGITNDRWYVLGEINIEQLAEEYSIQNVNQADVIDLDSEYKVNVMIKNMHINNVYKVKQYVNGDLIETIDIDSARKSYNESMQLSIFKGKVNYKVQIEKDNAIVCELVKNIYVKTIEDDIGVAEKELLERYQRFENIYSGKMNSEAILKLKDIEFTLESKINEKIVISETEIKNLLIENYNLLNILFFSGYENLIDVLNEINKISDAYIELFKLIGTNESFEVNKIKMEIDRIKDEINLNEILKTEFVTCLCNVLDDSYKILARDENELAIIEINKIKIEKIIEILDNIINEKLIDKNNILLEFSTKELTNEDVIVTAKSTENVKFINGTTYTFTQNGSYIFKYLLNGKEKEVMVTVDWIDKNAPIISGLENRTDETEVATINITDENLESIVVKKDGQPIQFNNGDTLFEIGNYVITATDKAGNKTIAELRIIGVIESNLIYYISSNGTGDGTSEKNPMNVNTASTLKYNAGDKILFKSGEKYNVDLNWNMSALRDNIITISSYGEGNFPVINGSIELVSNLAIYGLEFTNSRESCLYTSQSYSENIYISNCVFNNVVSKSVYLNNQFSNIKIDNCIFRNCSDSGIAIKNDDKSLIVKDVTISANIFSNINNAISISGNNPDEKFENVQIHDNYFINQSDGDNGVISFGNILDSQFDVKLFNNMYYNFRKLYNVKEENIEDLKNNLVSDNNTFYAFLNSILINKCKDFKELQNDYNLENNSKFVIMNDSYQMNLVEDICNESNDKNKIVLYLLETIRLANSNKSVQEVDSETGIVVISTGYEDFINRKIGSADELILKNSQEKIENTTIAEEKLPVAGLEKIAFGLVLIAIISFILSGTSYCKYKMHVNN